jgi:hypothetical protein
MAAQAHKQLVEPLKIAAFKQEQQGGTAFVFY